MADITNHLSTYLGRIKTFEKKWPFQDPKASLSKHEMAKAGFYYIGRECVKCYYCEKELEDWEEEDNAYEEHKKHAPYCPLVEMFPNPPDVITVIQAITLEKNKMKLKVDRNFDKWVDEFKANNDAILKKILKESAKHKSLFYMMNESKK